MKGCGVRGRLIFPLFLVLGVVFVAGYSLAFKLDVPYEPSSEDVVATMLEMAAIGRDDIVYDLGCGDGRIVIAASQKTGARGVGVDLDPQRIKESRENARRANVLDRVRFFEKDLFQTDIREATVLMLYLYPEINLKLRPKIFRELKPGTRVLSHSHDMGTWEPDQTRTAPGGHRINFWIMPANVSGVWGWAAEGRTCALEIHQRFQKISARLQIDGKEIPVKESTLRGDRLELIVEEAGKGEKQIWRFSGRAQGHILQGAGERAGAPERSAWTAKRDPASVKEIGAEE